MSLTNQELEAPVVLLYTDYTTGVDADDVCTDCISDDKDYQRQLAMDGDLCLLEVTWNRVEADGVVAVRMLENYSR